MAGSCGDVADFWEHLCQTQVPGAGATRVARHTLPLRS